MAQKKGLMIRSQADLLDFNDDEKGFEESVVDQSGYIPLGELVASFLRGERKVTHVPVYEVGPDKIDEEKMDEVIAGMNPARSEGGLDLADVSRIQNEARRLIQAAEQEKAANDAKVAAEKAAEKKPPSAGVSNGEAEQAPQGPQK